MFLVSMEREKYSWWERRFKEKLRMNRPELVEKMQVDYGLYTHLRSDEVITERDEEQIKSGRASRSQEVERLLDLISKKSESQQYDFILCLRLSNQEHLADLIGLGDNRRRDNRRHGSPFDAGDSVLPAGLHYYAEVLRDTYSERQSIKIVGIDDIAEEAKVIVKRNLLSGSTQFEKSEVGKYGDTKFTDVAVTNWINGPPDTLLIALSLAKIRANDRKKSLPKLILDQFPKIFKKRKGLTYKNILKELKYMLEEYGSSITLILDGLQDYNYMSFEINDIINGNKYAKITTIVTQA